MYKAKGTGASWLRRVPSSARGRAFGPHGAQPRACPHQEVKALRSARSFRRSQDADRDLGKRQLAEPREVAEAGFSDKTGLASA